MSDPAVESLREDWFCSTKDMAPPPGWPDETSIQTKGMADKARLWKTGSTLGIGFLSGSEKLRARVFEAASRWTGEGGGTANLKFERVSDATRADIRIAFDANGGSWSVIGTDARLVPSTDPTMNLGWATEKTPASEFDSVVLHEFGHAIGLLHEHNHPELRLKWKKDVVYADLGAPPNGWSKADVDYNVFEQYPLSRVLISKPDLVSIMIYTIPARWLDGQPAIKPSDRLSAGDRAFIQTIYP